jgi:hypothetical protein
MFCPKRRDSHSSKFYDNSTGWPKFLKMDKMRPGYLERTIPIGEKGSMAMSTVFCLDCEHDIDLSSSSRVGQIIKCPNCQLKMELIKLDPPQLDWVYTGPTIKVSFLEQEFKVSSLR